MFLKLFKWASIDSKYFKVILIICIPNTTLYRIQFSCQLYSITTEFPLIKT